MADTEAQTKALAEVLDGVLKVIEILAHDVTPSVQSRIKLHLDPLSRKLHEEFPKLPRLP